MDERLNGSSRRGATIKTPNVCPDPAAAPLGTDDEAAGTPAAADAVARARRSERLSRPRRATGAGVGTGALVAIVLCALSVGALVLGWLVS